MVVVAVDQSDATSEKTWSWGKLFLVWNLRSKAHVIESQNRNIFDL